MTDLQDIQNMYNTFKGIRDSEPEYKSAYNMPWEYYTNLMDWCILNGAVDETE